MPRLMRLPPKVDSRAMLVLLVSLEHREFLAKGEIISSQVQD